MPRMSNEQLLEVFAKARAAHVSNGNLEGAAKLELLAAWFTNQEAREAIAEACWQAQS